MKRARGRAELPLARSHGLVIKQLPDEVLVYDLERHQAHCLNMAAALVWSHCDGRKSVREISAQLNAEGEFTEDVVVFALSQLGRFSLLEERVEVPEGLTLMSRRELGRKLGLATAAALPFVISIVAPTAASAATCGVVGVPCVADALCCSGLCINGLCACLGKDSPCTTDAQCCSNRCGSALNKCLP